MYLTNARKKVLMQHFNALVELNSFDVEVTYHDRAWWVGGGFLAGEACAIHVIMVKKDEPAHQTEEVISNQELVRMCADLLVQTSPDVYSKPCSHQERKIVMQRLTIS